MGRPIRAILYDLDGILVETRKWHYSALNRALGRYGFHISKEDQKKHFEGLPTHEKLKLLTQRESLSDDLYEDIILEKYKIIEGLISEHTHPDPTKIHLLQSMKDLGYKQGVCTNTTDATVRHILKYTSMEDLLDIVLTRKDIIYPKPHPEIYLNAISALGFHASECLIIEDSDHGCKAALDSGAHLLHIRNYKDVCFDTVMKSVQQHTYD